MTELVRAVAPAPAGSYSIRLRTAKPPYALVIHMRRRDKPFAHTDFSAQATLLLGLIGNLDRVAITSSDGSYVTTTAAASRELGYDVKELGRDQERLTTYLAALRD